MSLDYQCNVCGSPCSTPVEELGRETASCDACGSTVRMRAVAYLTSVALFGTGLALPELPHRPHLRGLGLSDWAGYSDRFAARFDYTSTWYHQEPRLDITQIPAEHVGAYDVVVSSDVFEHVLPPVQLAFDGAWQLLKPGGALVLTIPFAATGETVEHYPHATDYEVVDLGDRHVVDIVDAAGARHRDPDPVFHGGPGNTLEMRVFSLPSIQQHLADAGFASLRVLREPIEEFGIVQAGPHSLPLLARKGQA